jgi:hypothetical protein
MSLRPGKHAALRSKSKDWLTWNQDNESEVRATCLLSVSALHIWYYINVPVFVKYGTCVHILKDGHI